MPVTLILLISSLVVVSIAAIFSVRNQIVYKARSKMLDWVFEGDNHKDRHKIFNSISFDEMLFSPKHYLKWSFESFYEAEITKQLMKE